MDIEPVIDQIRRHQPDRILASPHFVEKIVDACLVRGIFLPYVETIITGGGPVFPSLLRNAKLVCPNADVVTVYGSSEAEPISKVSFDSLSDDDLDDIASGAGLPVGFPVEQIHVRILPLVEQDEQLTSVDSLTTLRHICDEETKIRIDGEVWHRTGDVGYFDRKGRLWLTGRRSNMQPAIDCHSKPGPSLDTTFAQCIEAAALSDRSVRRAACVTVNDTTTLFIETPDSEPNFDTWVIKNRLNWGSLSQIKLVRKIPLDTRHSSKVLYHQLAKSA
jgi:acyl-CoA synthetase (AMP-forming)/AMP-acid ligase II